MEKVRGERRSVALFVALLLLCVMVGLAGCGGSDTEKSSSANDNTLRVGVRSDVVGFGYLNEDTDKYYGLEVDIAEELAKRLGYGAVEYVSVLPETRKDMLQNDEVDCLIACYSISETRTENFDFSAAYYSDESIVMVEDSSLFTDIEQLKGMTFGTMAGSNTAPQLVIKLTEQGFTSGEPLTQTKDNSDTQFDAFRLVQVGSYQELSRRLEEGSIDAACMDGSIAKTYLSADRSILDFQIDRQEYGVATQKDSALSKQVAGAIQAMLDDGTIAILTDKWN